MDTIYTTRKVDDRTGTGMAVEIGGKQVFFARSPMELAYWVSGFDAAVAALREAAHD